MARAPASQWLLGVIVPVLVAIYGAYCLVVQHGGFRRGDTTISFTGWGAIAFGLFWISFGSTLHHIVFWGKAGLRLPTVVKWTALASVIVLGGSLVALLVYYGSVQATVIVLAATTVTLLAYYGGWFRGK
jgi:hypothetical protein